MLCIMLGSILLQKTENHLLFIAWPWPILTNQVERYRASGADEKRVLISLYIKLCLCS